MAVSAAAIVEAEMTSRDGDEEQAAAAALDGQEQAAAAADKEMG